MGAIRFFEVLSSSTVPQSLYVASVCWEDNKNVVESGAKISLRGGARKMCGDSSGVTCLTVGNSFRVADASK